MKDVQAVNLDTVYAKVSYGRGRVHDILSGFTRESQDDVGANQYVSALGHLNGTDKISKGVTTINHL
jgi:hypothetical protein